MRLRWRRSLAAGAALGGALVLGLSSSALAQYQPTSTTSPSTTTSSTTPTSTTSTTTGNTGNSGASPGTTIASGSANGQPLGTNTDTTTPGSTVTVDIPGGSGSVQANATGTGPCTPGGPVSINLQLLQDGVAPIHLFTAQASASGGLAAVNVTIPTSAPKGTYVFFASCTSPAGILEIITSPLVLVTLSGGHASAPQTFAVSQSFGTPAEQAAVNSAVNAEIVRTVTASSGSAPNGGMQLNLPRLSLTNPANSSTSSAVAYGVISGVVVLVAAGLITLRRRRSQTHAS